MYPTEVIRLVLGIVLILFIPGFIWTFVLFDKREIDTLERIALSFGISIAVVPLLIFFLNKLAGMKITAFNSFLTIAVFCIVGVLCVYIRVKKWTMLEKTLKRLTRVRF